MKKKVLIVLMAFFLIGALNLHAFCVHNKTDKKIRANEISGGLLFKNFQEDILAGQTKCCNWKNRGCNVSGHRDKIVKFDIYYKVLRGGVVMDTEYICVNFGIKAGGDLVIKGKNGNYKCEAKDFH